MQYKSYRLAPRALPSPATWGGARNRADRTSWHLSRHQAHALIAAGTYAQVTGRPFNRHWTIHHERAGVPNEDGAAFVGKVLAIVSRWARRQGGELAAVWVRENGDRKGAHAHILMHLPAGLSLRNMTRRWIEAAGGHYRRKVSKVRSIGGGLASVTTSPEHYRANADAVVVYLLKGTDAMTGHALGLKRCGEGGQVIGKRAGWTQNIGNRARSCGSNQLPDTREPDRSVGAGRVVQPQAQVKNQRRLPPRTDCASL